MSLRRRDDRKAHERFLADTFLRYSALDGELIEGEAPDFRLVHSGGTVGLEVTELFRRGPTQESDPVVRESVIQRTVQEAQRIYEAASAVCLRVSIVFAPLFDPTRLPRSETAHAIAAMLLRETFESERLVKWNREGAGSALPRAVTYVSAYRMPAGIRAHWDAPQAGWVATLRGSEVRARIEDKATRLRAYRRAVANAWLLIAIEGRFPSQFFDDQIGFDPLEIDSPFDRTFLLDMMNHRLVELGHRRR